MDEGASVMKYSIILKASAENDLILGIHVTIEGNNKCSRCLLSAQIVTTHQCDIEILGVTGIKAETKRGLTFCGFFCDNQRTIASKGEVNTWSLIVA